MEDELKQPKKKRAKKEAGDGIPRGLEALAKFTSSDVIRQVKAGMSRIAPMETGEEEPSFSPEEPPQ